MIVSYELISLFFKSIIIALHIISTTWESVMDSVLASFGSKPIRHFWGHNSLEIWKLIAFRPTQKNFRFPCGGKLHSVGRDFLSNLYSKCWVVFTERSRVRPEIGRILPGQTSQLGSGTRSDRDSRSYPKAPYFYVLFNPVLTWTIAFCDTYSGYSIAYI